MKQRYHLFLRGNGIFYSLDAHSNKQKSLQTQDRAKAQRLITALNDAHEQPAMNLQLAQVYLQHSDPQFSQRTWQDVRDEIVKLKTGETKTRWEYARTRSAIHGVQAKARPEQSCKMLFIQEKELGISTD